MKKKLFALLMIAPLLAGCNFKYVYNISGLSQTGSGEDDDDIDDAGTYNIKIWVDDKIVDLTRTQVGSFIAESGGKYTINATIEPVSEAVAASNMLQDVQDGADIFCFAQDQLTRLKVAGALTKITGNMADAVKADTSVDSVTAASINGNMYAFPITADNGYFLYYDKSVMSADDASNMTSLLAKCQAAGKKLNFEARSNGFYAVSYFVGTGCSSTWDIDDKSGKFTAYHDNFNSAEGKIAAKGLKELDNTDLVATNSQASKLGSTAAALVSGIWEYDVALKRLGENLGCAALPSFTVDGKDYHLGSFDGYKLLGVKPQVDAKKASVCRKLARYLTNEACQGERFDVASWGPTNVAASQKESVLAHPGLQALNAQHEFAAPQGQCPGNWFSALATTATAVKKDSSDSQIASILANYEAGLNDLLSDD